MQMQTSGSFRSPFTMLHPRGEFFSEHAAGRVSASHALVSQFGDPIVPIAEGAREIRELDLDESERRDVPQGTMSRRAWCGART